MRLAILCFIPDFQIEIKSVLVAPLANYFEFNGQGALAERVYDGFRGHPFVAPDGLVRALLCTRLVHDLTGGQYEGTFRYSGFKPDTQKSWSRDIDVHAIEVLRAIEEEIKAGRLIGGLKSFGYRGKALVLQGLSTRESQHWIVDCDNGTVINNGEIRTVTNYQLFLSTLNAVLQIDPA